MARSGWVIIFACFIINLLSFGTGRVSATYYVKCMHRYNTTPGKASFPFVLCYTVRILSGPLVGISGRKFGLKGTILFGCVLCSLGIGLCYFAEDILTITIMWGIIYGCGFGFSSILLPAILNESFEKDKVKVNGIALTGGCVGGFIFPFLIEIIINNYDTSSSFLLLSGMILNSIPAAMLLKNPKPRPNVAEKIDAIKLNQCSENTNFPTNVVNSESIITKYEIVFNSEYKSCKFNIVGNSKKYDLNNIYQSKSYEKWYRANNNVLIPTERNLVSLSVENLQHEHTATNHENQQICNMHQRKKQESFLKIFCIFLNPTFILICVYQSLFSSAMLIIWVTLLDIARSKKIPTTFDNYLIGSMSVGDFIGRLCLGFLTDSGYLKHTTYIVTCLLISGISLILIVLSNSFSTLMISVFLCNIVSGALIVVFPACISEYIKREDRTMAMACRILLTAPFNLAISPLIGFVLSKYGSYDCILYILTICCLLCIVLTILTSFITDKRSLKL